MQQRCGCSAQKSSLKWKFLHREFAFHHPKPSAKTFMLYMDGATTQRHAGLINLQKGLDPCAQTLMEIPALRTGRTRFPKTLAAEQLPDFYLSDT